MSKCRQLRYDVLIQSDLARDGPQALDGLGRRQVIEFVKLELVEQQRSQSERDRNESWITNSKT